MSRYMNERYQSLEAYTPGEQPKIANLIKLNTNESPYPPAPGVIEAVRSFDAGRLRLYNDPTAAALNAAIAADLGVQPGQVLTGNGSDEILAFAFLAFGGRGVAFADITYGFYPVWANLFELETQIFPLREDFTLDTAPYKATSAMAVITNPNAPTGRALPLDAIADLAAANEDRIVLVDEAYVDFGGESAVTLLPKHPNILVTRTFSKSRSLAGGRLGFAVASEEIIADMNRIKYSFHPYNVNSLTQICGIRSVEDKAYFDLCRSRIMTTRTRTTEELEKLGFTVLPSLTNFVFARSDRMDGKTLQQALRDRGILVRRFDAPRIADYLRITIGDDEQMARFIEIMREILEA